MGRTAYNLGPGCFEIGGNKIYSKDDITITEVLETEKETSPVHGEIGDRVKERQFEISFTPLGEIEYFSTLYPYVETKLLTVVTAGKKIGDDIFPQTDVPGILWGLDGTKRTYSAVAMTKMPDLELTTGKSPYGQVTYLCLGTGDAAWDSTNNIVTLASGQSFPTSTLDTSKLLRLGYTGAWGVKAAPWAALKTIDGFKIAFTLGFQDKSTDQLGLVNKCLTGIGVKLTFDPIGVIESDILTALGFQTTGFARGVNLATLGADMVITGGVTPLLITAKVKGAVMKSHKIAYSNKTPRISKVVMEAQNTVYGGTLGDYFSLWLT